MCCLLIVTVVAIMLLRRSNDDNDNGNDVALDNNDNGCLLKFNTFFPFLFVKITLNCFNLDITPPNPEQIYDHSRRMLIFFEKNVDNF